MLMNENAYYVKKTRVSWNIYKEIYKERIQIYKEEYKEKLYKNKENEI